MTGTRLTAIILIFLTASAGWLMLGGTLKYRTEDLDRKLSADMDSLWGPRALVQRMPSISFRHGGVRTDGLAPEKSEIVADISHEYRYKGLLWYTTFTVDFAGQFTLRPDANVRDADDQFVFPLPPGVKAYDSLQASVDGSAVKLLLTDVAKGELRIPLPAGAKLVEVTYRTTGQDLWVFAPADCPEVSWDAEGKPSLSAQGPLTELRGFSLTVNTDFQAIDYPDGSRSPSAKAEPTGDGMSASWSYESALTNQPMGVLVPRRANAGPIVARMSYFAPVSLAFFLAVLFVVVVLRKVPLHPMHYLFIAAGFFAFHILLSYVADLIPLQGAFWLSAAVSVLLVVSYMRLVAGVKFALLVVGLAQLVYLVGFSYAFFWVGRTGLAVTIGAVLTLFVVMQATGRVNWHEVFASRGWKTVPPPLPTNEAPEPTGPVA